MNKRREEGSKVGREEVEGRSQEERLGEKEGNQEGRKLEIWRLLSIQLLSNLKYDAK